MTPGFIEEKVTEQKSGKAILVGVGLPTTGQPTRDPDLDELRGLATTAHYTPVADITQRLTAINPKTLIGSGKVEQIVESVRWHEPDVVIFDEALTPAQNKNLEKLFSCRVIDRHWLILEIFSEHARTREAKTQVELARLKYALPRLTKLWGHLSRQRGGIGLKEVGEKQIQLDKRLIRDQIHKLEKKLKDIDRERAVQRKSRRDAYQAALVGYTDVGKSTLMNCLTDSATLVENKLFATLDATVRKVTKNFPYPILMTDTVGLIDKLPHDLVASFKSTIDEVRDADLLLHVVDISHPEYRRQMKTAEDLLNELGAVENADILLVFNKTDRINAEQREEARLAWPEAVFVSCKKEEGLDDLRKAIIARYEKRLRPVNVVLGYDKAPLLSQIRKNALIVSEQYDEDAIRLDLRVRPERRDRLMQLLNSAGHNGAG